MIQVPQVPELPGKQRKPEPTHELQVDLRGLDPMQLIDLRARIDSLLPKRLLKDLNLEEELVIQLLTVQELQRTVLQDDENSASQMAQTAGQVASTLATLGKLQNDIYTSERLKRIEQVLIENISNLPMAVQKEFMAGYAKALESL